MYLKDSFILAGVLCLSAPGWACVKDRPLDQSSANCPPTWTRQSAPDSAVRLCTLPSFQPKASRLPRSYAWQRPAGGPGDSDWVAVALVKDSAGHEAWPPPLSSAAGCLTDCYTVDSSVVHTDTIAGTAVRIETGLVSGGNEGAHGAPRLVGGWETPGRTRVLLVGAARVAATLDTLRAMLRTLEVRSP